MHANKSIGLIVGLSLVAGALTAAPARADRSFSDITGTNIWNNTAPIFDRGGKLDPNLLENIRRVNRDSEAAFNACNEAIAQAEQNAPTTRRFARRPSTETAAVPAACRQLEQLRAEAETLRRTVQEIEGSRSSAAYATW
ncbi:MAG TPA: hypothetical protein DCE56_19040 [Cyanobacteria bacterium UBA8553]|nr:hypothetical protein [Cyanobacteria bacterium UBA8553]HAJ64733.1 hypothetical protein [Cyanobacteria bacterium UBA8543]